MGRVNARTGGSPMWVFVMMVIVIAAAGLACDLNAPLGVTGGTPYVALVLLGLWLPRPRHIFLLAALGSVLTIVGYFGSPDDSASWIGANNRNLDLLVIWITALLLGSRKQFDMELLKREQTLSKILDAIPDTAIISRLSDGLIAYANPAFTALFKRSHEEAPGMTAAELNNWVRKEDRDAMVEALAKTGAINGFDTEFQDNMGEIIPVSISVSVIDMDGEKHAVSIVRDITERQKTADLLERSEALLAETEEMTKVGGWELDVATRSVSWTRQIYRIFELPQGYDIGFGEALRFFDPADRHKIATATRRMMDTGQPYDLEVRFITATGRRLWTRAIGKAVRVKDKTVTLVGTFQDVTERRQTEEELQKLSRAVESSSSVVIITNLAGDIEYVNPKFTEVTGYTREEAMGQNPRMLKSGETLDTVYADLWAVLTSEGEWKGEFHNQRTDGSHYWGRTSISGVRDHEGNITHYVGIQDDVTHEYELSEQLSRQASHDALTGLFNRHEFERRAEQMISTVRRDQDEHALCFLDLDQFKVVNDTCGHMAGDEMLRQIGQALLGAVRHSDTLARLGGDEFGVLMEHCSLDHAHRVATSLLEAIQNHQFAWEGHTFKVGVSIGLVAITEDIPSLAELMRQADAACYMAKDLGRNCIQVYHAEDSEIAQRHGEMQWVERIHGALEDDRFCLYAQTIASLDGSTGTHYELLVRMKDEKGKLILPGAFLPAAERYNLITQVDCWVTEKALALLAAHPVFVEQIDFISINLSGQSMARPEVLDVIISQLNSSGIEKNKICFEITETGVIANLNAAISFISTLKELGCRFALDDFGSGLSSFGYLKTLPVNYLKIDGMFVRDIVEDPIDRAMVKSINEIGHVMGMKTIAEFVENDEIKGMLREIGVNYAQGYGIGKPLAFVELLGRSRYEQLLPRPGEGSLIEFAG